MQRLNGREIYVLVILILVTALLVFLMVNDIFSDLASVQNQGGTVTISQMDLHSHIKSLIQIILNLTTIILFWRIKKTGWILAFPVFLFYAFIIGYLMWNFGYVDVMSAAIGLIAILIFLTGLLFLVLPSTLRKYNIKRMTAIPVVVIVGLLFLIYTAIL